MPENGVLAARAPASHVATGEWQSFELRMRRRRAERCLLRADIALEAGFVDDAREAVEEARQLAPAVGGLSDLEARIVAASLVTDPSPAQWPRMLPIAIGAAFAILAAVIALTMMRSGLPHSASAPPSISDPIEVNRGVPALVSFSPLAQEPAPDAGVSIAIDRGTTPAPADAERALADAAVRQQTGRVESADATRAETAPTAAAPSFPLPVITQAPPDTIVSAAVNAPELPPPAAIEPAVSNAVPLPSATAAPEPTPVTTTGVSEDAAVRAVLARYASAYGRLDASAAQAVWPGVDAEALGRAFDGLSEQEVSLGACTVDVSGASARASCAGSARWTPRVGNGGIRTERRAWTFELSRTDGGWRIESARVRPR